MPYMRDKAGRRLDSFRVLDAAGRRPRLHALGDSLSRNGLDAAKPGIYANPAQNPWVWASMLSGGKLPLGTVGATGGFTTQQITDTHLATVLAAVRPGDFVGVLGGTNDITSAVTPSVTRANLLNMYQRVADAGAIPLCCSIPPRNTDTSTAAGDRIKLNMWIEKIARDNGWPFLDFYVTLADPATFGGFATGLNIDTTHPNGTGAKAMGTLVAARITPPDAAEPYLAKFTNGVSTDPSGALLMGNACMVTDSNVNGAPDQFSTLAGTLDGGSGYSLVDVAGVAGKMFKVTRGDTGTANVIAATSGTLVTVPVGNVVELSFRFKLDITAGEPNFATSGTNAFAICQLASADGSVLLAGLNNWDTPTPLSTFTTRFVMPTVPSQRIQMSVSARNNGCSLYIGQLTVRDLTALGLA